MELYLRDGGIVLEVPLNWLETESEEQERCTCYAGKRCAWCMGLAKEGLNVR